MSAFLNEGQANSPAFDQSTKNPASFGLPVAVTVAIAILVNFFSGWYKKADMEIRSNGSLVLVVLIAVIIIVVFITLFSAYHKWDINEQHYRELLARKDEA